MIKNSLKNILLIYSYLSKQDQVLEILEKKYIVLIKIDHLYISL